MKRGFFDPWKKESPGKQTAEGHGKAVSRQKAPDFFPSLTCVTKIEMNATVSYLRDIRSNLISGLPRFPPKKESEFPIFATSDFLF